MMVEIANNTAAKNLSQLLEVNTSVIARAVNLFFDKKGILENNYFEHEIFELCKYLVTEFSAVILLGSDNDQFIELTNKIKII